MTALQYVNKRENLSHWMWTGALMGGLFGGVSAVVCFGMLHAFAHPTAPVISTVACFGSMAAAVAVGSGINRLIGARLRNFESAHPEMCYVDDWEEYIGSVATYPVTDSDRMTFAPTALSFIKQYAWMVNAIIRVRDLTNQAFVACTDENERRCVVTTLSYLNNLVDTNNTAYILRFRLLTERCKVLCGPEYESAKKFRESLIKATPAG